MISTFRNLLVRFLIVCWILGGAGMAMAQKEPRAGYIFPPVIRIGETTPVQLGGYDFTDDMQWFVHHPEVQLQIQGHLGDHQITPPPYWSGPRAGVAALPIPREVSGLISVGKDVSSGLVYWQVANANGGSATSVFFLSDQTEVVENRSRELPQHLPGLPIGVSGRLSRLTEVDRYTIVPENDGPIYLDWMARRLGSPFNGVLHVHDANGVLIADYADLLGGDGGLVFNAVAGATYTISIFDADFRGDPSFVYRLSIRDKPSPHDAILLSNTDRIGEIAIQEIKGGQVSGASQAPQVVTIRVDELDKKVFSGAFSAKARPNLGQKVQNYRWESSAEEEWNLRVASRAIQGCLDVAIKVFGPDGNVLAENDGLPGTTDAGVVFKAPTAGAYTCEVRNYSPLHGTAAEVYRIDVHPCKPSVVLTMPQVLQLPLGKQTDVVIQVQRLGGFHGPIELEPSGFPEGVSTVGAWQIAEGETQGKFSLVAATDAKVTAMPISIKGWIEVNGEKQEIPVGAVASGVLSPRSPTQQRIPTALLAVTMEPPFEIQLIDRTRQRDTPRGACCLAEMEIVRKEGFDGEIAIEMAANQSRYMCGSHGPSVLVARDQSHAIYPAWMSEWLATDFTMRMATHGVAQVPDPEGNLRHLLKATDAPITMIMEGALLKLRTSDVESVITAGESFPIPFTIARSVSLPLDVEVQLDVPDELTGLVTAETVQIPADQDQGVLHVTSVHDFRLDGEWRLWLKATALQEDRWPVISQSESRLVFDAAVKKLVTAGDLPPAENENSQPAVTVDYARDVRPILRSRCLMCHGEVASEGDLRLDQISGMLTGGSSGPAIVPGNSRDSLLIKSVLHEGDFSMPPTDEGQPLSAHQIDILKAWIDQGAIASEDDNETKHWAFQNPVRPAIPDVAISERLASDGWGANPLDRFVLQKLQQHGLSPLPPASQSTLLRRVYLDLIGLPPTAEQLEEFLQDDSENAWENLVDHLLANPRYGERWGRHWMDVWRYSDWDGYGNEVRESKPHIWRWRDWIIESLNNDKPYNQMVMEMLAGDELAPDDPDVLRATGFLVRNWYLFNRNTWIDNTIEHTGKAFLGMTFNCARCHDHIYDPMKQTEYYQLRAFFEPHEIRVDRVPGQPDVAKDGLVRVYDAHAATPTVLFVRGNEKNPIKDRPLPAALPEIFQSSSTDIRPVRLPAKSYYPGMQDFIIQESLQSAQTELQSATTERLKAQELVLVAEQDLKAFKSSDHPDDKPKILLTDDFSKPRLDVWRAGRGQWEYDQGRLIQRTAESAMCTFDCQQPHPADFNATLKFRILGGNVYRSTGLIIDAVDDNNLTFIYLSAGGSKLQVGHRVAGADQYPAAGAKSMAIATDRDYELQATVRGTQLEVHIDGKLELTYTLPASRPVGGRVRVWTYDASAEFQQLTVVDNSIRSEAHLQARLQELQAAANIAEHKEAVAKAAVAFANARTEADRATFSQPPDANASQLAFAAGKAERELAVAQARLNLLTAEQQQAALQGQVNAPPTPADQQAALTKSLQDAEAATTAARTALDMAVAAAAEPFDGYTKLSPVYPETSTGRRLALARWIADNQNPLTARVAVNHIWLRHFHQPLVSTVFDFGVNGRPPSHPELLDWLAHELMDQGWSMKAIHRLIVTSAAYRMASSVATSASAQNDVLLQSANTKIDPDNQFLWRQSPKRMEAEVVRDATLSISGQLTEEMYGPDLDPQSGLTNLRRSVYFRTSKEKKMTFLETFDSPNPVECYQRTESISPQQSLALSNSPLTLTHSRITAARIMESLSRDDCIEDMENIDSAFVQFAFQRVLTREPDAEEMTACLEFLTEQTLQLSNASSLTLFSGKVEAPVRPSENARQRARENLVHVLFNHNDFVTIR